MEQGNHAKPPKNIDLNASEQKATPLRYRLHLVGQFLAEVLEVLRPIHRVESGQRPGRYQNSRKFWRRLRRGWFFS